MSALHWEARRKQAVVDSKLEMQRKQLENEARERNSIYSKENIAQVAEKMSIDPATPMSSLLHRSHAQLVKSNREIRDDKCRKMCEADNRQMAKEGKYSAKIKNRYTSINYVQQY